MSLDVIERQTEIARPLRASEMGATLGANRLVPIPTDHVRDQLVNAS